MLTSVSVRSVAGLEFVSQKCPKCGRPMYKRPCPCRLNRKGWKTCAQCVKCGTFIGLVKKTKKR